MGLNIVALVLLAAVQESQRERCNISMSHVAGGTVGGVAMGAIVTLVATVLFFKLHQAGLGLLFNYTFRYIS